LPPTSTVPYWQLSQVCSAMSPCTRAHMGDTLTSRAAATGHAFRNTAVATARPRPLPASGGETTAPSVPARTTTASCALRSAPFRQPTARCAGQQGTVTTVCASASMGSGDFLVTSNARDSESRARVMARAARRPEPASAMKATQATTVDWTATAAWRGSVALSATFRAR
jgi:hypothetical protein